MEILILNWKDIKNPDVGGAEIIAFEFARRLVKEGHKVTFFSRGFKNCLEDEKIDGVDIVRKGNKFSVYFHAYRFYKNSKKKPDIVIDMINTICWQTPLYIPKKKRIAYLNQLAKEVFLYEFPWPLSWISYVLERFEYKTYRNDRFICYSKSTKEDLISFGIPDKNIALFPLGLDHNRYSKGNKKSEKPLFIFVARLVKMKKAALCVEAMNKVIEKYPEAKMAIIGYGPEEKKVCSLIEKLNLNNNVFLVNKDNFFIDKNVKDVKVKLMKEAWALLLPSVKEGWGMVVTEAAACGTLSIVSNITGLKDSVINNETGIILSKNPSILELSNSIVKIIEDNNLRKKLEKGAIKWSNNFNWDKSYQEFKKIILN